LTLKTAYFQRIASRFDCLSCYLFHITERFWPEVGTTDAALAHGSPTDFEL
jgi:hypothetical protein